MLHSEHMHFICSIREEKEYANNGRKHNVGRYEEEEEEEEEKNVLNLLKENGERKRIFFKFDKFAID